MRMYRLHVTFIDKDGKKYTYEVSEGDNLLDIAQENDLEMEGMLRGFWSNSCRLVLSSHSELARLIFFGGGKHRHGQSQRIAN